MIKLYNHSQISDEVLLPVLNLAKASVPCHGNVIVKVTKGGYCTQSVAIKSRWVAKFALAKRKYTKSNEGVLRKGRVLTDGGYIILSPRWKPDPLVTAKDLFEYAVHEFAHVRDFQKGEIFGDFNRRWKNRPHERNAVRVTQEAVSRIEKDMEKQKIFDEVILNLGVEIERIRGKK